MYDPSAVSTRETLAAPPRRQDGRHARTAAPRACPARRPDLLAAPVAAALTTWPGGANEVLVAEIDPELADRAAFCERYGVPLEESANCVVVHAKRAGEVTPVGG